MLLISSVGGVIKVLFGRGFTRLRCIAAPALPAGHSSHTATRPALLTLWTVNGGPGLRAENWLYFC
jgi:hypothetical protein